jgi:hypothetical protein
MNKPKLLLHIGSAKAGSSTIQKHIFNSLTGAEYLGRYPTCNDRVIKRIFDKAAGRIEKNITDREIAYFKNFVNKKKTYVFSWEGLTAPRSGTKGNIVQDVPQKCQFLNEIFDVEVLFITRDQTKVIPSLFVEFYFDIKKKMNVKNYPQFVESRYEDDLFWQSFKYDQVIHSWSNYFEKYTVIDIDNKEQLKNFFQTIYVSVSPDELSSRLENYENKKVKNNQSRAKVSAFDLILRLKKILIYKNIGLRKISALNFLLEKLENMQVYRSKDLKICNYSEQIKNYYFESNKNLAAKFGVDYL